MQQPWIPPSMQIPTMIIIVLIIVQQVIVPLINANPPPVTFSYKETT